MKTYIALAGIVVALLGVGYLHDHGGDTIRGFSELARDLSLVLIAGWVVLWFIDGVTRRADRKAERLFEESEKRRLGK